MKARTLAALTLLVAAIPAHAELYKCKGQDGKIAYQDTPCATASSERLNIQNKASDPYSQYESEIQAQRDISAAERLDAEHERRRKESILESQEREDVKQAKSLRCARYKSRSQYLEARAYTWLTLRYREEDLAAAQALRNKHWSECFAGQ